jgi:peptide/nickel transport system permease protein
VPETSPAALDPTSWRPGPAPKSTSLRRFAARRLLQVIPLVALVILLNWALIQAAPGDPSTFFTPEQGGTAEQREEVRETLGLNRPWYTQLFVYGLGVLHLDFGDSIAYGVSVVSLIGDRLWATLLLAGSGFLLSTFAGVFLGVIASRSSTPRRGGALNVLTLVAYSIPVFWLAQLLLLLFALQLGWLPAQGMSSLDEANTGLAYVADVAKHLVLPVLAYAVFPFAMVFRLTYGRMQETLRLEFIATARSKGVSESRILYRHALPNAMLPVITVIGSNLGFIFAGSVLVETVFAWPGIGGLLSSAIVSRDYPVILGIFTLSAVAITVANALTDILYARLDPRISL